MKNYRQQSFIAQILRTKLLILPPSLGGLGLILLLLIGTPVLNAQIIVKDSSQRNDMENDFPMDEEVESRSLKSRILQLKKAGVPDDEIIDFFSRRKKEPDFDVKLFLDSKGKYSNKKQEEEDILSTDLEEGEEEDSDSNDPYRRRYSSKKKKNLEKDPKLRAEADTLEMMKKKKILLLEKKRIEKETFLTRKDTILDNIFGQKMFSQKTVNFAPDDNIVPPQDYPLGPGDEIIVTIWGNAEFYNSYELDRDGSIYPEGVGRISLLGTPLKKAKEIIKQKFEGIIAQGSSVEVSVGRARTIRVNVVGEVVQPGSYNLSALHNAFNALYLAGGPNEIGSLRTIYLKRDGKTIDSMDVYGYLIDGDLPNQMFLRNNDFIIVPTQKKVVSLAGAVKRETQYELRWSEQLQALLKYSGGAKADASLHNIQIRRYSDNEVKVMTVNLEELNKKGLDYELRDGDSITFMRIRDTLKNSVEAMGEIAYPGIYQIKKGDRVSDLLEKAGGLTKEAYNKRIYVLRINDLLEIDYIPVDYTSILKEGYNSSSNIALQQFDALKIFYTEDFKDTKYITVKGEVRKSGAYIYTGRRSLKDIIYLAGGPTDGADLNHVELSRVITEGEGKKTKTEVLILKISNDWENDASLDSFMLKPYDQLFFRQNPSFELQENVYISGEVKYPGEYSKTNKGERISSLVKRAGGLTFDAYVSGAIIIRKKEEVVIDLTRALENPGSAFDNILKKGDRLIIPEVNDIVRVEGAVLYPVNVSFDPDRSSFQHYLNSAGGFRDRAMKRKSFVKYANGKIKRTKTYFFLRSYPLIEKGATIIVPEKPARTESGINAQQLVGIISSLVTIFVLLNQVK